MYFIIRNRKTGAVLPVAQKRNKTSIELSTTAPPRLFVSKAAAQQALKWWVAGEFYFAYRDYVDFSPDRDCSLHRKPKEHRRAEDMEVREIAITLSYTAEEIKAFLKSSPSVTWLTSFTPQVEGENTLACSNAVDVDMTTDMTTDIATTSFNNLNTLR